MVSSGLPLRSHVARRFALASILAVAACGGGGDTVAPTAVARVVVSGVGDSLTVGERRSLSATVQDAKGSALVGRRVTWSTSDPAVASVDSTGQLTALGSGVATVAATSEGVTGSAPLVVKRTAVSRVTLDRAADTLWLTRSHDLTARALGPTGETLANRAISWVSLDPSIVSFTQTTNGAVQVRGVALGTTKLVARSEGIDTTITVSVVPIPIARIALVAPDTVYVGKTSIVRAQAWAPDGVPLVNTDLAGRPVIWTTDAANTVTADGIADESAHVFSGLTALVKGWRNGSASVTATVEGLSARATIATARAPIVGMRFFPTALSMRVGETAVIAAQPMDLDSIYIQNVPLTWSIASGASQMKLTQSTAGGLTVARVEALAAGTTTVGVTAEGKTYTFPVTVTASSTPMRVYPTAITAAPGATGRLTVIATDPTGTSEITSGFTFRSADPSIATVDATGRVKMVAPGSTTVITTVNGVSASTDVTVRSAPTSAYHIDVRPAGTVPPEIMAAARTAAARWERVVASELAPTEVQLTPGACISGVGAVNIVTTGLVVYVSAEKIDGSRGVLAFAGPCVVRGNAQGGLPSVATMTIDLDDIPLLTGTTSALAADVIAHELGHALGIGTLWGGVAGQAGYLTYHSGDLRYVGPNASSAAVRIGLERVLTDGVAVEDAGGLGTAGGHWRERTYLGELMTGYIGTPPNPLSVVTVQSLKDLGYDVTETGADIVSLTTLPGGTAFDALRSPLTGPSLSRSALPTAPLFQIGERLLRPRFSVDRAGRKTSLPQ